MSEAAKRPMTIRMPTLTATAVIIALFTNVAPAGLIDITLAVKVAAPSIFILTPTTG